MNQRKLKVAAVYESDKSTPKHPELIGRVGTLFGDCINIGSPLILVWTDEKYKDTALKTSRVLSYDQDDGGVWVTTKNSIYNLENSYDELENQIKAGCSVLHKPTGEKWFVLGVSKSKDRVCIAGYPPTIAYLIDCEFINDRSPLTAREIAYREKEFGTDWE